MAKNHALQQWRTEDSIELYGIRNWGAGYFNVNDKGDVVICPDGPEGPQIAITEIIAGLQERGYDMPVLLRVENILDSRISSLHKAFRKAISELNYRGQYRGVFPIKVNQQQQVVEKIAQFGAQYHHGLEVGSKAELIAAVSLMPTSCGYIWTYEQDGEEQTVAVDTLAPTDYATDELADASLKEPAQVTVSFDVDATGIEVTRWSEDALDAEGEKVEVEDFSFTAEPGYRYAILATFDAGEATYAFTA